VQVMRKKSDATSVSNTSGIAKKTAAKPRTSALANNGPAHNATKKSNADAQSPWKQDVEVTFDEIHTIDSPANKIVDAHNSPQSNYSSRETSSTPLENDLLRYLTAHISAPTQTSDLATSSSSDSTSFEIGANEYLVGVVRLIQNDYPEISKEINVFLGAMQQAFLGLQSTGVQEVKA
jgi:hypothetical protein